MSQLLGLSRGRSLGLYIQPGGGLIIMNGVQLCQTVNNRAGKAHVRDCRQSHGRTAKRPAQFVF